MPVIRYRKLLMVGSASAALILPILIGVLAASQTPQSSSTRAQLEVASVRRNDSAADERYIRPSVGRLSVSNMSIKSLLKVAYGVMDFQISGAPNWIDSENYDIEAKSEGVATPNQMTGQVLQSVLEQRFKLSARQVIKELPIYVLTASKPGPNLQPSSEQICVTFDPANPPLPGAPGRNPNEMCGSIGMGLTSLNGKQVTMAALAMAFAHLLGRTVIDKTNLAGEFDARVTYAPIGSVPNGAVVDPRLPDFFTAAREQLGLKLESGKGPVEVLVIDHVERPSEN